LNLILFGAPGAGKGTQSAFITERYRIPQISTGDLLRAERRAGTELGKRVQPYMDSGALVPDDLIIEVARHRLEQADARRGFVLDGFPRTVAQAQALDAMLNQLGRRIEAVLYLQVARETLIDRLARRLDEVGEPRPDDQPQVVARRIDVFLTQTSPLIDYYSRQGKLHTINGERSIEAVRDQVFEQLESLNGVLQT
jgi:adenylate kinase